VTGALLILAVGIVSSAVSFIFIRESTEPSVMLAAWRVLLAALILLPWYFKARRQHGDTHFVGILKRSLIPACVLAIHFITWVIGARLTTGANATLVVNLMPLVMPVLMYLMYRERLHRREILATACALGGLLLLALGDVQIDRQHVVGDLVCLLSMGLFAVYLALARGQAVLPSVWLYVVPMYALAGIIAALIAPFFGPIQPDFAPRNVVMVLALAGVSTVIGHSALNYAMQQLRGQTVTVLNLFQFVVAAVFAYFIYDEVPGILFYPASGLVTVGLLLIVWNQRTSAGELPTRH